ncbi:hypothetical protein [Chryseobacterium paridis]|uniref:Uncharacterized protein n=1 Tax=Chryseobacterium paridis TaxID=2800328 RepID=A0ABS1FRU4_9FLAO|nr:hypothetical protein [Chryseobacterium paridis]MBK1895146.1 hypothetical protein [Chryseobacterium paridis]
MIDKIAVLRLEDTDDRLYTKNDINGEAIYFLDKEFTQPFTGEIFIKYKDEVESEAEYKNGYKNGIEYIYTSEGILEQTNENKGNLIFGISKEYDEEGQVVISSIVYNNDYLKSVEIVDGVIRETTAYNNKYGEALPEYIKMLLSLSDEEVFNYEFKINNPYLNYSK